MRSKNFLLTYLLTYLQVESSDGEVVTDNGVRYEVTDKGQQMVNDDVMDQDDAAGQSLQPPVIRATDAEDDQGAEPVTDDEDVPSILIPPDLVIDVKKKWVYCHYAFSCISQCLPVCLSRWLEL